MKLNPQIIGNVGLYYCCYRLSMLGWNVMPTARNARGVDIVAYSANASRYIGIQVKALSKRNPVPLGPALEKCTMGNFWIIVNKLELWPATPTPSAYILTPDEVRQLAHRGEKDGRVSYWLEPGAYEQTKFAEQWERIHRGGLESQEVVQCDTVASDEPASQIAPLVITTPSPGRKKPRLVTEIARNVPAMRISSSPGTPGEE